MLSIKFIHIYGMNKKVKIKFKDISKITRKKFIFIMNISKSSREAIKDISINAFYLIYATISLVI